jgi:hypothetical protein
MRRYCFSFLSVLLFSATANAQVHKCGNIYTDKPCDQVSTSTTLTQSAKPSASREDTSVKSKKRLLAHDLRTRLLKAGRKYDIDMDISQADEVCLDDSTSLEDCRKIVNELDDKLDARVVARKAAGAPKNEPPTKTRTDNGPASEVNENNSTVVIQEDDWPDHGRRHPDRHDGDRFPDRGHDGGHRPPDRGHDRPRPGERGYEPPGSGLPPFRPERQTGHGQEGAPQVGAPPKGEPPMRRPGRAIMQSDE